MEIPKLAIEKERENLYYVYLFYLLLEHYVPGIGN